MTGDRAFWLVRGVLLGTALFAVLAHALLAAGASVPPWVLAACAAAGVACGRIGAGTAAAPVASARPWLVAATFALPLGIAVLLAYGALATPDRAWDGIVAWGIKTQALQSAPTLQQPLFADAAVFHHSPDYPLLLPLCVAACGRGVFPLQYLLLVALVGLAVARRTGDGAIARWSALGIALLPELIGVGGGGVDSGYAETLHALALAAAAAALLLGDAVLLLAAALLLPFVKPEGTVHALLLVAAVAAFAPLRSCAAAVAGAALSLCIWLPLQLQLAHAGPPGPWLVPGVVVAAAVVLAARALLRGRRLRPGALVFATGGAVAAGVAVLLLAQPLFAGSRTVLFAHYLGDLERAVHKLPASATIAAHLLTTALSPRRFGALFVLLTLLACARHLRARTAPAPVPHSLAAFMVLLLLAIVAAFYLSPEADVVHHLRSSADRLLLQTAGVGWLVVGAGLAPRVHAAVLPRWLAAGLGRTARPQA